MNQRRINANWQVAQAVRTEWDVFRTTGQALPDGMRRARSTLLDENRFRRSLTNWRWLTVFGRFSYDPRFAIQSAEFLYAQECRNISSNTGLRQFPSHQTVELAAGHTPDFLGDRLSPRRYLELIMAVPKRKISKSRTRSRKANWNLKAPQLGKCQNCGNRMPTHVVCPQCGHYMGRPLVDVAE